jgi:riboflavin synthase
MKNIHKKLALIEISLLRSATWKKCIQKKLLSCKGCGLVMVMGFAGNMAQGGQDASDSGKRSHCE